MNKKKLSVVMAGAMLASSVAPVLAATVEKSEVSADNLGLLIRDLRTKLQSATFADESVNGDLKGKSIYKLKIKGDSNFLTLDADSTQAQFQTALKDLTPGQIVEVWSKGYVKEGEKYYANEEVAKTYTADELSKAAAIISSNATSGGTTIETPYSNIVTSAVLSGTNPGTSDDTVLTITLKGTNAAALGNTITLKVGDKELDLKKYINADDGVKTDMPSTALDADDFLGFPDAEGTELSKVDAEKLEEITITSGGNNLSVEDIYDGLMLTTKGHDFFTEIKDAEIARTTSSTPVVREIIGNNNATLKFTKANFSTNESKLASAIVKKDGKASFTITVPAGNNLGAATYTVTGTNESEVERLAKWIILGQAKVDILAGSNRYATAVTIAKEYAGLTNAVSTSTTANIVLVNGNSLVDGLAAAPLAAAKSNTLASGAVAAPVLLTEADKLPKETKAYLKDVIGNLAINNVKAATIHIVGGETVVSKDLERELKSLGFKVERYGGDNREETSLEVAEAIGTDADNKAFVVGANGEADAMSIAAKAAENKTPIIVAKNGGISEDAIYELRDKNVTVIGGENAVSATDYEDIKLEAATLSRIAGSNRQETNALIIEKYYGSQQFANNVIVAKDGQHKKSELIDALAAANFASEVNAPVVLATNKLTDSQINALELNAKNAESLYQVGIGVDRDNVVKVIAQRLGLAN